MSGKKISIVVPALNEELTIGKFVDWCKEGLAAAGRDGEVIIIDSSEDKTAEIAASHGAKVIKMPRSGLGQAYIDALPHIEGDYVIMGDCDLTYDFRDIKPFVEKLDRGYEFVMGSRIKGNIESGAMPPLHRYFGNPVTTFILNVVYGSRLSDIHCGMRAITLDALKRVGLESSSWEYASEMILKAVRLKLKITEVPINFYKDQAGRVSHHKRLGWLSPWIAGWINLKVIFLYAPDYFLMRPGIITMLIGFALSASLANGPIIILGKPLSLYWMLAGSSLTVIGYSAVQMAVLARTYCNFIPEKSKLYKKIFSYNSGVSVAALLFIFGTAILIRFLSQYVTSNFMLSQISYSAIFGLLAVILGFQTFTFTLLFNLVISKKKGNVHGE